MAASRDGDGLQCERAGLERGRVRDVVTGICV